MRVTLRRRQKQLLSETAKPPYLVPRKAAAHRPTVADWPAPGRARISPMANRVISGRSREPDWPQVRLRLPALSQVFRRPRAILVLADFCLAATATARPLPLARLPKAGCWPRPFQSRNPHVRPG